MNVVRTGLLIGGPCDGQAVRVAIGQPKIIVSFTDREKLETSLLFDPATPDAEPIFSVAIYNNAKIAGIPETKFEFFVFEGTGR